MLYLQKSRRDRVPALRAIQKKSGNPWVCGDRTQICFAVSGFIRYEPTSKPRCPRFSAQSGRGPCNDELVHDSLQTRGQWAGDDARHGPDRSFEFRATLTPPPPHLFPSQHNLPVVSSCPSCCPDYCIAGLEMATVSLYTGSCVILLDCYFVLQRSRFVSDGPVAASPL